MTLKGVLSYFRAQYTCIVWPFVGFTVEPFIGNVSQMNDYFPVSGLATCDGVLDWVRCVPMATLRSP